MKQVLYQPEEKATGVLSTLWETRGYLPFRMSKFEEYDLYVKNKDFLVSDSVITFTDRSGCLLALKPDVTLSIVKNYTYTPGVVEKVYYNERVYRVSGSTHEYREIPQSGLECIGDLDFNHTAEVVALAARSLASMERESVLEISHLGILSALLEQSGADRALSHRLSACLSAKNAHDLHMICAENKIDPSVAQILEELVGIHGSPLVVLPRLKALLSSKLYAEALNELEELCKFLSSLVGECRVSLDFSIVQDLRYYSGIVFRGYLAGVPECVLSGGRYDRLVRRFGKEGGAIGFAIYLDRLKQKDLPKDWDVDVLLIYDGSVAPDEVWKAAEALSRQGERVMTQRSVPDKLSFGRVVYLREGGVFDEANA